MWPFSTYTPPEKIDMYTANDVAVFLDAWDALDVDKSGFVEAEELLNSGNLSAQALRTTKSIFASADADNSGELSKWELLAVAFPLADHRCKMELFRLLRFIEATRAAAEERRRAGVVAQADERLAKALAAAHQSGADKRRRAEAAAASGGGERRKGADAGSVGEEGKAAGKAAEGGGSEDEEEEDAAAASAAKKLPPAARKVYALLRESQQRRMHAAAVLRLAERSERLERGSPT